jgi:hypothetical protein
MRLIRGLFVGVLAAAGCASNTDDSRSGAADLSGQGSASSSTYAPAIDQAVARALVGHELVVTSEITFKPTVTQGTDGRQYKWWSASPTVILAEPVTTGSQTYKAMTCELTMSDSAPDGADVPKAPVIPVGDSYRVQRTQYVHDLVYGATVDHVNGDDLYGKASGEIGSMLDFMCTLKSSAGVLGLFTGASMETRSPSNAASSN